MVVLLTSFVILLFLLASEVNTILDDLEIGEDAADTTNLLVERNMILEELVLCWLVIVTITVCIRGNEFYEIIFGGNKCSNKVTM